MARLAFGSILTNQLNLYSWHKAEHGVSLVSFKTAFELRICETLCMVHKMMNTVMEANLWIVNQT